MSRLFILSTRTWVEAGRPGRTMLVIPGEAVTVRWVTLKAAGLDQAAAAAALMLEDEVSAARESLHFAAGEAGRDGRRCVAIITRSKMQALLDEARALGVAPDAAVPDCLMLPEPAAGLAAAEVGGMLAVRGREEAFTAEPDLAQHLIGGRTVERIDDAGAAMAQVAAAGAPLNLLQGAFGPKARAGGGWGLVAALAVAALLSPLAVRGAEIVRLEMETAHAQRQLVALTTDKAAPWRGDIRLLGELGATRRLGERFLSIASVLARAIEDRPGARLERLTYQSNGEAHLSLTYDDPGDLAAVNDALQAADLDAAAEGFARVGSRQKADLTLVGER